MMQLREASVSRFHTVVWVTPQGAYIRDEGSSLGTFVNNQPINKTATLRSGDVIQIGYCEFLIFQE